MPNEIRDTAIEITKYELRRLVDDWESRTITPCEIFNALFCKVVYMAESYQEYPQEFLERLITAFYKIQEENMTQETVDAVAHITALKEKLTHVEGVLKELQVIAEAIESAHKISVADVASEVVE